MLPECSKLIQDMFAKGLNVNGSARPTAAEFLRHRAFNLSKLKRLYSLYSLFSSSYLEVQ